MLNIKMSILDLERIASEIKNPELSSKVYEAVYGNIKMPATLESSFDEKAFNVYKERVETIRYNEALETITTAMYKAIANKKEEISLEFDTEDLKIYQKCLEHFDSKVKQVKIVKTNLLTKLKLQMSKDNYIYLKF